MVLYFSGTGNSQWAALRLAELIADDEVVSMNQYLKNGKKIDVQSQGPLVFVAPTYCWRLPRTVERWILESSFPAGRDTYFVLTCGGSCGNAAAYAEKLCEKKGLRFCGLAPVMMPENYLALYPTPGEPESRVMMENAGRCVALLAKQIKAGEKLDAAAVSFGDRIKSGPVNPLFYKFIVRDKGFTVSESCVSCGKCAMRCPMNNIDLKEGKPVWKGNCTHCMACIGGCPTGAIDYKSKTKECRRYYIMDDSLNQNGGGGRG